MPALHRFFLVLSVSVITAAGQTNVTWFQQSYNTGANPLSIVSGDFNHDGRQDIAVAAYDERAIVIHYGDADGAFAAPVVIGVCGFAKKVVTGDFNHDGIPDLATLNDPMSEALVCPDATQPTVSVLYGSAGQAAASFSFALPKNGVDIAAGDIDGNGHDDLVVLFADKTARVIRFNPPVGASTWTISGTTLNVPGSLARRLTIGRLNSDARADMVVSTCCTDDPPENGFIHVLLSNGDGTFGASVASMIGEADYLTTADINDDAKQDIVAPLARCGTRECSLQVIAFRNNGGNTFTEIPVYIASDVFTFPLAPVVGDFTGDGRKDVAFVTGDHVFETGGEYVFVVPQNSDGSFQQSAPAKFFLGHDLGTKSLTTVRIAGTSGLVDLASTHAIPNTISAIINTSGTLGLLNCNPPETVAVNVCRPESGTTITGQVHLLAAASVFNRAFRFEVWEGGTKLLTGRDTHQIDAFLALPDGSHTLTFVARNADNTSRASKSVAFRVANQGVCALPTINGVNVCSPVDGSTMSNPVRIQATAKVTGTVYRFELWIDGVKKFTVRDSNVMSTAIKVAPGIHRIDFVGYNIGRTSRVSRTVHVTVP